MAGDIDHRPHYPLAERASYPPPRPNGSAAATDSSAAAGTAGRKPAGELKITVIAQSLIQSAASS
jgi:hypothetical protein